MFVTPSTNPISQTYFPPEFEILNLQIDTIEMNILGMRFGNQWLYKSMRENLVKIPNGPKIGYGS